MTPLGVLDSKCASSYATFNLVFEARSHFE